MHAGEYGDVCVEVVVELDVVFGVVGSQEPAHVLHDSSFERDGEGEKEGVELGPVEPFAEVGAGGDDHDPVVGVGCGHGVMDCGEGLLAEPAFEDVGVMAGGGELAAYGVDVDGPLGEHKTGPAERRVLG